MNQQLQDMVVQAAGAVKAAVVEYGPTVVNVLLEIRRFEAVQAILQGLVMVIVAMILYRLAWGNNVNRWKNATSTDRDRIKELKGIGGYRRSLAEDRELFNLSGEGMENYPEFVIPRMVLVVMVIIGLATYGMQLLDLWNWIGLFRPDWALAHDAVNALRNAVTH